MSNEVFPKLRGFAPGPGWEPRFSTKILQAVSGKEYRAARQANPLYGLSLRCNFLRPADLQALLGFFLARQGAFDNFLYEHPEDKEVVDQVLGTANGVRTTFQLYRSIAGFTEPVQNPKVVTNVKVNGVVKALGADYTVSATGLVIFTSPPLAGPVTWTGQYYYRARFADDSSTYDKLMHGLHANKKIDLVASLGTKI